MAPARIRRAALCAVGCDNPRGTLHARSCRTSTCALASRCGQKQHGPSLPLLTDTLIAIAITEAIGQHHKIFQLPAITFGCLHEHSAFHGTVSLSAATLAAVVTDIRTSLAQQGIGALIVVNGHGGNYVLDNVVQQANADAEIRVGLYPSRADWTEARQAAGISSSNHDDMHAGELETSVLLAAHELRA